MKKPVPLVFAVVILLTLVLPAYSQTGSQELVRVTIVADPAECVGRVAVFSYTRSTPVSVQWDGRSWVSEPLPKGENILISYEQKAGECEQYVMVNEQTLDKHFSDRIVMQLTYNATISIKASRKPSVYVTVTPNPADCLTGLDSNKPVRKQDGGYVVGPSKPGETVTITPVIAEGCMFVEWSGVQTPSQRQLNLNPQTNMTLFLTATAREYDKPQQHDTSTIPAVLAALADMLFKNMPLIVIPVLAAVAASTAVKTLRKRREKVRREQEFQRKLLTARTEIANASTSQIVKRGWLWLEVDPVKAIVEKHDIDRRITAYLMLAGVIPVSPEKRRRIDEETVAEYYAATSATLSGYVAPAILSTIGQKLVKLSVQLAATDMDELEKVRRELRSRGVDPYIIPSDLVGLDMIVYEARGVSVYNLGMKLEDEVKTAPAVKHLKCPSCGSIVYEDFRYCVACGAKQPAQKPQEKKAEEQVKKQTAVTEVECPACGRSTPRGRYCIECGSPLTRPEAGPAITEPKVKEPEKREAPQAEPPVQPAAAQRKPAPKPEAGPEPVKPPAKPVEPVKTVQPAVVVETREVWQPPSWIVRDAERLGVDTRQLTEVVETTYSMENLDKAAYKAASILADRAGLATDEDKASFITYMSNTLYHAIIDYRSWLEEQAASAASSRQPSQQTETEQRLSPQQTSETMKPAETEEVKTAVEQKTIAETPYVEQEEAVKASEPSGQETVLLEELVENGPKPGTAYLLDEEFVTAPGLPSAVLASRSWRNCKPYDMDSASYAVIKAETAALSNQPALLTLTRAIYPSTVRRVGVDRSYKGFIVLLKTLELGRPMAVLTHKTIYEALPENLRQKLKPVKVVLDLRQAVERASRSVSADVAVKLAVAEALMPGICQTLAGDGVEGVKRFLKQRMLDDQDAGMIASALAAAVSRNESTLKSLPRSLLEGIGLQV
ncbi:MAG: hypothetical protein QXU87_07330 [Candidatus Caldarchaeum sp.]